ncbi:helix-turn-helix transcriptional regulator [Hydrogenispora ethanolica]|nr:PAS domain-containing protein [Hydrogenispora ethanolica]
MEKYVPMVDFLAEVLGDDAEIVLHDMSDINNSVVAIRNSHVSGREIGAPATNLVLKILKDHKYGDTNYITNYQGVSGSGKNLRSSTYFIKDDQRRIVGMLCINIDFEKLAQFRNYLDNLIGFAPDSNAEKTVERFSASVSELALESIETVITNFGISPERMSQDEKIEIIKELNNSGVFLLKGSIGEVASQLKVSEATIYRYLNKVKKE